MPCFLSDDIQAPSVKRMAVEAAAGYPHRACGGPKEERGPTHTLRIKASRLKAHGIPSVSWQEPQPRIPQMSNKTHEEVSLHVRRSASERERGGCVEIPSLNGSQYS